MRLLTLAIAYLLFCDSILCRHVVNEDEVLSSPTQATQYKRPPHEKESTIKHKNSTTSISTSTPIPSATGHSHKHADPLDVLSNIFSILFLPSSTSTTSNVSFKSATLSTAPHRSTVHRATEANTASQRHTGYNSAPTTHMRDLYSTASHAVHTTMITKSKYTVAEDHTKPIWKPKSHHVNSDRYKKKTKHKDDMDDDDGNDSGDDEDDDDDDGDDGGKRTHSSSSIIPSVTMLNALPSLTATAPDPKKSQMESEMVAAERTNKIIGIVVGLGCVAIGSAGLVGYILSRRQDRRQERLLADGSVQTRWRPQSFLAVVSTAVNRVQHNCTRDNSFKSNRTNNSQGMPTSMQAVEHGYAV